VATVACLVLSRYAERTINLRESVQQFDSEGSICLGRYQELMDKRFKPPYLESCQVQEARNQLHLFTTRRESFRLGNSLVRLLVDGDEHLSFDPSDTVRTAFSVRTNAGFIELHGDDDQGDILLAAFMMPECLTAIRRFIDQVALRHTSGHLIKIRISSLSPPAIEPEQLLQLSCTLGCRWI
jgi:hypothetical protein